MSNSSIITKFEQQVSKYPDKIAIKTKQYKISYKALNQFANQMANLVNDGQNIVILMEHEYLYLMLILQIQIVILSLMQNQFRFLILLNHSMIINPTYYLMKTIIL